jgi:RNA polymerase sigma-B factor
VATVASHPAGLPTPPTDVRRRRITADAFQAAARAREWETRRRALERAVVANLGVARTLAARHRDKGVDLEDLEQVAYTSLVGAVQRFDPGQGHDFLAFAVPTIRGELKRHFRDCGWAVRPPRRLQEVQLRVLRAQARLHQELERPPTPAEIADDLGIGEDEVAEALRIEGCFRPTSLDRPLESGSGSLGEGLTDRDDDAHEAVEARVLLGPAVRALCPRDRYVLALRFYEGLTQQEIGNELGITQAQVSRILSRICDDLREALTKGTACAR